MKKATLSKIIKNIGIFLFFYVVIAFVVWLISLFSIYNSIHSPLSHYVQEESITLKKEIFSTLFDQGEKCNTFTNIYEKDLCHKKISHDLSVAVKEERLRPQKKSYSIYDWPTDLFFVKRDANQFKMLGWNGEVKDISSQVNATLLDSSVPYIFKAITRKCTFFKTDISLSICEIYQSVPLENHQTGYMVRILPLTDDDEFFVFLFIFPLLGFYLIQSPLLPVFIGIVGGATILTVLWNRSRRNIKVKNEELVKNKLGKKIRK